MLILFDKNLEQVGFSRKYVLLYNVKDLKNKILIF
jgi:hypothetical protein